MDGTRKMPWGSFLIMAAAALWALDALIRTGLTKSIPPASIVFFEHLIGFIILLPIFIRAFPKYRTLSPREWLTLIGLTIVSSVLGTLLFTEALARSFATFDFATPVLLQKLQPVFVIFLSAVFLHERLSRRFLLLVPAALLGSYLVSFGGTLVLPKLEGKFLVFILAIGASLAWGAGTILSKKVLTRLDWKEASAMRFLLAIPIAYTVAFVLDERYPFTELTQGDFFRFVAIALSTGAVAILIYYRGLAQTPARVSTIAELTFPAVSLLIALTSLNPYGEPQVLSLGQGAGVLLLLSAIIAISFDYAREESRGSSVEAA